MDICSECGKPITDAEYVINWGTCDGCFDASYQAYLDENPQLELDLETLVPYPDDDEFA